MTFYEWIEKKAEMKIRFTQYEQFYLREAYELGKADCQEEIERLTVKAQRTFDAWVEEKLRAEKALLAIAEIANIFTSETDPTRACHRIQAIVHRHGDPNETDTDRGRGE